MKQLSTETSQTSFAYAPAYPVPPGADGGITVRDLIAAMALQGLAVNGLEVRGDRHLTQADKDIAMARRAYGLADAMVQARNEEKQESE